MYFTANHLTVIMRAISIRLGEASDLLCQLDGQIGDGDHGTTMALGFEAVVHSFLDEDISNSKLSDLLILSADNFLNAVGATTGPLYASAFRRAAAFAEKRSNLEMKDAPLILAAMSDGIAALGKAEPGDKTMMDVWFPVAHYIRTEHQENTLLNQLVTGIRAIATDGVATTKTMVASKGRAARLGERSLGHADPGASSAAIIINCFCDFFEEFDV